MGCEINIQKRRLGKTGIDVTILGLGGEGILRTHGYDQDSYALINRAIDLGITYFESARAYAGSESYYGKALNERRKEIFLTSKSHARDRGGASAHLEETLSNMKTDYLDLWQVHDVRTEEDIAQIFGAGGAVEAFIEAKEKGIVRLIGITGHHDPSIMEKCIKTYDFDTVLIPVNPAEPQHNSFLERVIGLAREKDMGIIGMKVYIRGLALRVPGVNTLEPFFRFALSYSISTTVIGCDDIQQLEENVGFARAFSPMTDEEKEDLIHRVSPYAKELVYYKP